jgi:hypothetical protein
MRYNPAMIVLQACQQQLHDTSVFRFSLADCLLTVLDSFLGIFGIWFSNSSDDVWSFWFPRFGERMNKRLSLCSVSTSASSWITFTYG